MSIFDPYARLLKNLNPLLVDSYSAEDPYSQGQGSTRSVNYALGPTSSFMTPEYLLSKNKKKKKTQGLFQQESPSGLFEEVKKYGK